MFLYDLTTAPGHSLYERLTGCIRRDILEGRLPAGSRLPSKRRAAAAWGISVVTVMAAYDQLLTEGYLVSEERRGYFVAQVEEWEMHRAVSSPAVSRPPSREPEPCGTEKPAIDLIHSHVPPDLFPLSVWNRLLRKALRDEGQALLSRTDYNGLPALRSAIRDVLYESRGIRTEPDNILISAGNEQLYATLLVFLGRDRVFGVEDPGYPLIPRLYGQNGVHVIPLPLDAAGVSPAAAEAAGVNVLHISPNHHFPTGIVTPVGRRQELLAWLEAAPDRYIIEDDYDSEFRMAGKPIPSLQSMDRTGRVIYINTFSKTVAPSLRIGYAVLPPRISLAYRERLGFLSCPVAVPEQYVLAAFMADGSFARHINRMRTRCRAVRDTLLTALSESPCAAQYTVSAADGGLHFLLTLHTALSDPELCAALESHGVRVRTLRDYYAVPPVGDTHTLVMNYAGLSVSCARDLVCRLDAACLGQAPVSVTAKP